MPFKSEAQRKWMYANDPEMAKRWEAHTPEGKLPERVGARRTPSSSKVHPDLARALKDMEN